MNRLNCASCNERPFTENETVIKFECNHYLHEECFAKMQQAGESFCPSHRCVKDLHSYTIVWIKNDSPIGLQRSMMNEAVSTEPSSCASPFDEFTPWERHRALILRNHCNEMKNFNASEIYTYICAMDSEERKIFFQSKYRNASSDAILDLFREGELRCKCCIVGSICTLFASVIGFYKIAQ